MNLPLNQLKIDSPCPVAWNTMRGDHRSRFCGQCRLHVHNVSAMTRPEVDRLMASSNGRVCLNGFARPDGELVTMEALAELMELHGAPPARIAAVRAALAAGFVATALTLAACSSEPTIMGALPVEPRQLGGEVAVRPAPPEPQPPLRILTGGAPAPGPNQNQPEPAAPGE